MKIAVVSSGLGHVVRGVEAWALATAEGLAASGADVTLFAAAGFSNEGSSAGIREIRALKRGDWRARLWAKVAPGFTWRWGWKSPYALEQTSFAKRLMPILCEERFDIVHLQDPLLALYLQERGPLAECTEITEEREVTTTRPPGLESPRHPPSPRLRRDKRRRWRERRKAQEFGTSSLARGAHRISASVCSRREKRGQWSRKSRRRHGAKVLLAHGTEESVEFLSKIKHLQELSPAYAERHPSSLPEGFTLHMAPNFVDPALFRPINKSQLTINQCRAKLGIPPEVFVIGSVGALQKTHKRLDYLMGEIAQLAHNAGSSELSNSPINESSFFLCLVGASTEETGELESWAHERLGDRCLILKDLPFDQMPDIYRCFDLYVHPATEELFGICFLEAMASGVPCVGHFNPTTKWIIGKDLSKSSQIGDPGRERRGAQRRGGEDRMPESASPDSCIGLSSEGAEKGKAPTSTSRLPINSPSVAGTCFDMEETGAVARFLGSVTPEWLESNGKQARQRVEQMFSREVVVSQYVDIYGEILDA